MHVPDSPVGSLEHRSSAKRARGGQAPHGAGDCRHRDVKVSRGLCPRGAGIREGGQTGSGLARGLLQPGKRTGKNGGFCIGNQKLRALPGACAPIAGRGDSPLRAIEAVLESGQFPEEGIDLEGSLGAVEKEVIQRAFDWTRGNQSRAAQILQMKRVPKKIGVLGGGVIGVEYASIFAAMGVHVTLIETRDRILPFVDTEIMERLVHQLEGIGVDFVLNDRMTAVKAGDDHVTMTLEKAGAQDFDIALIAVGRQSNVEDLDLESIGVKTGQRGLILVDEKYRTNVPNIYAAGDVIGFPALAATSMEQARVAMIHAFGKDHEERLSPVLPFAVYAIPEISMVGKTEDECKAKNIPYAIGCGYYEDNARGQIIGDMSGMVKLIFSPDDKKLLGVHIIGEQAAELIHLGSQLMMSDGDIGEFVHAVYNYPTLSDLYKAAAHDGLDRLADGRKH